jgi:hypothetical protein
LSANYGALPSDRRNLFNAAYSIDIGNRVHMNPFVNGALNGWQFSGVTQVESGSNLTFGGNSFSTGALHGQWTATYTCLATAGEVAAGHPCPQSAAIIPGSVSAANPTGIAINNQSILGTSSQDLNPLVTCGLRGGGRAHQFVNGNCLAPPTVPGHNGPNLMPAVYGPAFVNSDLAVFKNFAMGESRKLQVRMQAYNFLNHPLWSFPSGTGNLTAQFTQDPVSQTITQSNANFGVTTQKQGQRIVEFGAKFFF